jgi:hypothetical protein
MQDAFGDTQIEDLWIRYFCVATNVSKSRMDVYTTGPLWKYVRSSATVRLVVGWVVCCTAICSIVACVCVCVLPGP